MTADTKTTTYMKITRMKSKIGSIMYTCHASLIQNLSSFLNFFLERKTNSAILSLRQEEPCKYENAIFLVGKMIHFDFQCARILLAKKVPTI